MLKDEEKREAKAAYFGNAIWRIMLHACPHSQVPSYSQYVKTLNGTEKAEASGQEIVNSLIDRLRVRKEKKEHDRFGTDGHPWSGHNGF